MICVLVINRCGNGVIWIIKYYIEWIFLFWKKNIMFIFLYLFEDSELDGLVLGYWFYWELVEEVYVKELVFIICCWFDLKMFFVYFII